MIISREDKNYQQCSMSVMDNIGDPEITFDSNGVCNYYGRYLELEKELVHKGAEGKRKLEQIIETIKNEGKGKQYDCITGVSGGVDSTYVVYLAKQFGLRPLLVHFDNGWNSELAVKNIEKIVTKLGFDLYTLVVNWEEFKDLQLSYIKASVVDIEVPTDHAINGTLQRLAEKYKIKYILSGGNVVSESILPRTWTFNKSDYVNLQNIHKKFGMVPLKTYPLFGFREQYIYGLVKKINTIGLLNYLDFNVEETKKLITREFDWKDYGGKHYESVFTKFYQGYILPTKFHIDKRKPHLSNLIFSGQMTREEALEIVQKPTYNPAELRGEMDFVLKKFNITQQEFDSYMQMPRVDHLVYGKQQTISEKYPAFNIIKPFLRKFIKPK